MKWIRQLYDWVLNWANTSYALPALMILAFLESSIFPIPPDVLLIALSLSIPARSFVYASWTSIASVLGGVLGYILGWTLWELLSPWFFEYVPGVTEVGFAKVGALYEEYNFWIVFIAGFTPIPYKLFTLSAGVFQISFVPFLLASIIGRSARFFLVSALIYFFGEKIKVWIDRYFNVLTIGFVVLLVLGFLVFERFL